MAVCVCLLFFLCVCVQRPAYLTAVRACVVWSPRLVGDVRIRGEIRKVITQCLRSNDPTCLFILSAALHWIPQLMLMRDNAHSASARPHPPVPPASIQSEGSDLGRVGKQPLGESAEKQRWTCIIGSS